MGSIPTTGEPEVLIPEQRPNLTASYLYTAGLVALLLSFSFLGQDRVARHASGGHALFYAATIVEEFVLLGLVWIGARIAKLRLRDLIGGRWKSFEDFLLDLAIAAAFWILSVAVLFGLGFLLGLAKGAQMDEARRLMQALAPNNVPELVVWILLSTTAGFCEEIIFRGYLQRQFTSMIGNLWLGMLASALIFGLSHAYEGRKRMILIAVYGALFGTLAILKKSLRPGMMAHAWHDTFAGVGLYFINRMPKSGILS